MWKIEREVELKWQQATIKNDLIFTWLFFENKKLTLGYYKLFYQS